MLISIIIPIAKSQFLKKAIDSVINQTYTKWELILIDDLVDLNVYKIVDEYKNIDNIKLYRPEMNLGAKDPTLTWNYGLKFTSGKFGVLLGDDDFLSNNYLEEMVTLLKLYPQTNIFRSRLFVVDQEDKIQEYGIGLPTYEGWDELMYNRNFYERRQSTSEFFFNIDVLKKMGGFISFPYAWASDDATWLILAKDFGIYSSNEAIAYFRRHAMALSDNMSLKKVRMIENDFNRWSEIFICDNYNNTLLIDKDVLISSFDCRFKRMEQREDISIFKSIKRKVNRSLNKFKRIILINSSSNKYETN